MSEVEAIFDAIGKVSKLVILHDKARELESRLYELNLKRCGICGHWMKNSCKPEKVHKQFKSCNSHGCKDFTRSWWVASLEERLEKELTEIQTKIQTLKRHGGEG